MRQSHNAIFSATTIKTPLGEMWGIADEDFLYLLAFIDQKESIEKMQKKIGIPITQKNTILQSLEKELEHYFQGELLNFQTLIALIGTSFQKKVWNALQDVRFGKTCSYKEIATVMGHPSATRAVANAIGDNPISLLIPCHRIIRTNGKLGGYNGGIQRKKVLLENEKIRFLHNHFLEGRLSDSKCF